MLRSGKDSAFWAALSEGDSQSHLPVFLGITCDNGGLWSHHPTRRGLRQYSVLVECFLLRSQLPSLVWVFLTKFCVFEVQNGPLATSNSSTIFWAE